MFERLPIEEELAAVFFVLELEEGAVERQARPGPLVVPFGPCGTGHPGQAGDVRGRVPELGRDGPDPELEEVPVGSHAEAVAAVVQLVIAHRPAAGELVTALDGVLVLRGLAQLFPERRYGGGVLPGLGHGLADRLQVLFAHDEVEHGHVPGIETRWRRRPERPVGEAARGVVELGHEDVRVRDEELGHGPGLGGRGRIVARPAREPLVVPPALGEIPVEIDARLGVFAPPLVAVVILVLDDDRPARLLRLLVRADPDHEPGVDVVDDERPVRVLIAELGDEAVAVEVVGPVLVDLAVAVVVAHHAVLTLGDALLEAVEDAVGVDDGADVEGLGVDEGRRLFIDAVARDQLVNRVEADLVPGVFVAMGRPADPLAGLSHIGFHRGDVLDALGPRIAEPDIGVDGRPRLHVRNDEDVDRPAHRALADLQERRDLRVGGGDGLEVFRRRRVALVVIEGYRHLLGRPGGKRRQCDGQDHEPDALEEPIRMVGCHAVPPRRRFRSSGLSPGRRRSLYRFFI